jgi:hypothetical protein
MPTNIIPTAKMDRKTLKRLRNRVSASRCRIKKKNWIRDMEEISENLTEENNQLMSRLQALQNAINACRQLMNGHHDSYSSKDLNETLKAHNEFQLSNSTLLGTVDDHLDSHDTNITVKQEITLEGVRKSSRKTKY